MVRVMRGQRTRAQLKGGREETMKKEGWLSRLRGRLEVGYWHRLLHAKKASGSGFNGSQKTCAGKEGQRGHASANAPTKGSLLQTKERSMADDINNIV